MNRWRSPLTVLSLQSPSFIINLPYFSTLIQERLSLSNNKKNTSAFWRANIFWACWTLCDSYQHKENEDHWIAWYYNENFIRLCMTHTIREMRIIENRRHDIILDKYFVGLCIWLRKIGIIGRHDIKLSCVHDSHYH